MKEVFIGQTVVVSCQTNDKNAVVKLFIDGKVSIGARQNGQNFTLNVDTSLKDHRVVCNASANGLEKILEKGHFISSDSTLLLIFIYFSF